MERWDAVVDIHRGTGIRRDEYLAVQYLLPKQTAYGCLDRKPGLSRRISRTGQGKTGVRGVTVLLTVRRYLYEVSYTATLHGGFGPVCLCERKLRRSCSPRHKLASCSSTRQLSSTLVLSCTRELELGSLTSEPLLRAA